MSAPKIKICGMKDAENILRVASLQPDFMGFIFYPHSERYVGKEFQMPELHPSIRKVGVFVNENPEEIKKLVKRHKLNAVQLHGSETPDQCRQLMDHTEVIKAFGIGKTFDPSLLASYTGVCHYFLFDTKSPGFGGSGERFDWTLLPPEPGKQFFLSGGIGPGTEQEILTQRIRPFAIDLNSCFEDRPGIKNISKLKSFIDELQG